MTIIVRTLFNALLPLHARWIAPLVATLLVLIFDLVRDLEGRTDLNGAERRALVMQRVASALDELDTMPAGWAKLSEARRDAIIRGLLELALMANRAADDDDTVIGKLADKVNANRKGGPDA
jgi:hypothetical protein